MKKILLFMMVFIFTFAFIGCIEETTTTETQTTTTQQTTTQQTTTQATTTETTTTEVVTTTDNDPVISGADDITIEKNSTFIPLEGVTAYDVEDGDITDDITYNGNVNPMAVGIYTATYTVVDSDGNVATVTRTVTVVFTDVQAPLLAGVGNVTIFVGEVFDPLEGVSATDTIDGAVDVTFSGDLNVWAEGDYVLHYSAEDESGNEATKDRTITVSYGDFIFGDSTDYVLADLSETDGVYSTPVFSGGVINQTIADFTYIKVNVTLTSAAAGTVNISLNDEDASADSLAVTGTSESFEVIYVITEALTDVTFDIDSNGVTLSDISISVTFAEIRDMVAPVLNVPNDEAAYVVGYSQEGLDEILYAQVTAVDNIDGNISDQVQINYGDLDLDTVGEYEIIYTVSDQEGNESTFTRTVIIGNIVDSGYISDPTFQNNGDGQWHEKSSDGQASISYDNVEGAMNITIDSLGSYPSAAGAYFKEDSNDLEVGQWYVFTFTVKTTIDRTMGFRMGLVTDQANGWVDDFDGRNDHYLQITSEYQTFNFYFKLDTLTSSCGYDLFIIELNLGNYLYSNIGKDGVTTFKDVAIYKVVTSYEPPTYVEHVGADLNTKFTVGDTANDWSQYVTFYDMSGNVVVPAIDASAVNMNAAGTYDILFTATDEHNEVTTYTLTIDVLTAENADVVGPVVTLNDGVDTDVDQFTSFGQNLNDIVTAVDAVDGEIDVLPAMVDNGGLNLDIAGVYTITYEVYDLSGNITTFTVDITVLDKEGPYIIANDQDVSVGDDFDPFLNVSVNDNTDGAIDNSNVVVTGLEAFTADGVVTTEGEFDITYTVTDSLGNETTKTVTIYVTNIVWDESTRTELGDPDEGPTHSTATYDAVEDAILITAIDPNTASWDHARWVYYFDTTQLVPGMTYKFEITVKADIATDIYFRVGSTLMADPWIDNFTGGLKTISVNDQYATYQVVFTVDKDMPLGTAKFQFMYGYLATDATNTIYVKSFDLVQEQQPEYIDIDDLYNPDEIANSSVSYDLEEDALVISDMVTATYDWDPGRLVYYISNQTLEAGHTYRIVFTAKADVATELRLRIGSTLWADPWIDDFDGGLKTLNIGIDYNTYELIFTVDKDMPNGNAKFQFMYGFLATDTGNQMYVKDFMLQELGPVFVDVNEDMYAPDEVAHSTTAWDGTEEALIISDMEAAVYDWDTGRLVYYIDEALLEFGNTYRITFTVKADVATEIHLRIGSTLWADPWIDNFEGGLKTVNVGTEYTTFEFVFTVDKDIPNGNAKFQFMYGYLSTDAGNRLLVKDFALQQVGSPYSSNAVIVDDFTYADEAALGVEWTERTSGTNTTADLSDRLNLDAENNSMTFVLPDAVNNGWTLARAYDSLSSFGAVDSNQYLAFYVTNNTDVTSAGVWLYWSGSQNAFTVELPAIGESGWVFVKISDSGHNVSEITDFGFGFDNQAWSVVTGSITFYKIALVDNPLDLLDIEVLLPVEYSLVDDFAYVDEAEFGTEWTERTSGSNTAADLSDRLNLDSEYNSMTFYLPEVVNNGWTLARAYDALSNFGASDDEHYLAFYITNNTDATTAGVWLYWSGSQNAYTVTLPAAGESGWVYVNVSDSGHLVSEITDFGFGFDNQPWNIVTGSITFYQIVLLANPADLDRMPVEIAPQYALVDDFTYADEAAFGLEWTERTSGTNTAADLSDRLDLDAANDSITFDLPDVVNNGWTLIRAYDPLSNFTSDDSYQYLAFFVTNNTDATTAGVWLYWSGSQNAYTVTLPAAGESGWVYVNVADSGHAVSEITDYGFGFDNQAWNIVTGSITFYQIVLVKDPAELDRLVIEVPQPANTDIIIDDFTYADEAAFGAEWSDKTYNVVLTADLSANLDLDAVNDTMVFNVPDPTGTGGWTYARRYDSLANLGGVDANHYLCFYVTNNTNKTTASVWLFWTGSQNSYTITLPAIGESGWAYVDISDSGHTVTEIIDFGIGYNNWESDPITGTLTIGQIKLTEAAPQQ